MQITTSPNIADLDSKIVADLCAGQFIVDLTPSVWISTGYDNVLGSKVQVTNPYGVIVRAYPDNFDAAPSFSGGMDIETSISVPTQAGTYQYGKYIISVQLTDADGTEYVVTKSVSICAPNSLDSSKKFGNLSAKLTGICNQGKVYVLVDNIPNYKGFSVESSTQSFELDYPTGSGESTLTTPQGSFSVQLYEGVYKIAGEVCATYNYGDNVYAKVKYVVNYSKPIICSLDESCVFVGLDALYVKLNSDCSEAEKRDTNSRIEKATLLLDTIDFGIRAGEDVSDYILNLEAVLQLTCSCAFNNGTPIINNDPSGDILIQGCNVEKEVVGLTTVYTINNYSYQATVSSNGGVFNVSNVVLNGCVQSQNFTFNVSALYSQIKGLANTNLTEALFWASIIKKGLNTIDASCLDLTTEELTALTLSGFLQKITYKACSGGNCAATLDTLTATQDGGDVVISWTETDAYSLDIFVDGVLVTTVLNTVNSYTLPDYADGITHTYRVITKCSNGIYGTALQDTFGFTGCAAINPPNVSMTSVANATCPYDLTGLLSGLPIGITAEWHTANNHLATSLVPDETSVTDGIYYAFATDGNNCFSTGVKVTVTCAVSSSCSAPQNLTVTAIIGGLKVAFQSALYPPPANSYTVKRKPAASADVDGSYTTIGTPTFNVSTGKWEITDSTAVNNTLYTYKSISNCTDPQSILVNFSKITCPTLSLTDSDSSMGYSFTPVGGEVDKYEVEIWDSSGITKIHTDTFVPTFTNPITGSFNYLTNGNTYKVRTVIYIGTYVVNCAFVTKKILIPTVGSLLFTNATSAGSIVSFSPGTWATMPTGFPIAAGGTLSGTHTDFSGSLTINGNVSVNSRVEIYVNSILYYCSGHIGTGAQPYVFTVNFLASDSVEIKLTEGDNCP